MYVLYVWLVVAAIVANVEGFASGAPGSACLDMIPQHPAQPQKSASPYRISVSSNVVKAGQPVVVTVTGKDASQTIRGLLLQARHNGTPVGKFTVPPNNQIVQLLNCGSEGNAVTHKKHDNKYDTQTVSVTWTPPAGFDKEVVFRATVALNGAVFWVGVESEPVKVVAQ